MTALPLVPAPTSLIVDAGAPFRLHAGVEITGDADAVAILTSQLDLPAGRPATGGQTTLTVETVKAYIDRASALTFKALHLHLTDDQGWRLEIRSHPELTARAAASAVGGDPGGFYTHDDYREIVAYAAARHMTVVPEIDVPGHTHAVSLALPELSEEPVLGFAPLDEIDPS